MNPSYRRYQISKKISNILQNRHPWVFSGQLSSAASVFADGDWIRLVDGSNAVLGFGIFSAEDTQSIRVFHFGETIRNRFFFKRLRDIVSRRLPLLPMTHSFRLIHAESDGWPGITADLYNDTVILQYASKSLRKLARLTALLLPHVHPDLKIQNVQIRPTPKTAAAITDRALTTRGEIPSEAIAQEAGLKLHIEFKTNQNPGIHLDLRPARNFLRGLPIQGMRVLNLYAGTGAFSILAEQQGAHEVVSVDSSRPLLDTLETNLKLNEGNFERHQVVNQDIFYWLSEAQNRGEKFDLILIAPPSLTSRQKQLPQALKTMNELHSKALSLLQPGGAWITCCRSPRVLKKDLIPTIGKAAKNLFGKGVVKLNRDLGTDCDHPELETFPQGKYLKQFFFTTE